MKYQSVLSEIKSINKRVRESEEGKKRSLRDAIYLARSAKWDVSSPTMDRITLSNGYTFLVDNALCGDELSDEITAVTIEQFYKK